MSPANGQKVWNNASGNGSPSYGGGLTGYGPGTFGSDAFSGAVNLWHTAIGMTASTTNNPTGVYDMAGGIYEMILDNYNGNVGNASAPLNTSTAITTTYAKYINIYSNPPLTGAAADLYNGRYNLSQSFFNGLGRATFETGGNASTTNGMWNGDQSASFASTGTSWVIRSGNAAATSAAGIFAFNVYAATGATQNGTRLVLSRP